MRKEIVSYLQKRPNAEVVFLVLVAVVGLCILFLKPYRISAWIDRNEIVLLWSEIGLLVVIVGVLMHQVVGLQEQIETRHGHEDVDVSEMFNFYDERGEMKLSVKPNNLYYIETADNYVQIHYQNQGKMQVLMIRNSMKNIEWRYKDTSLVRCHRSYLVNLQMVQMLKRTEGEVLLDFNDERIAPLPVSRAYANQIMKYFAK